MIFDYFNFIFKKYKTDDSDTLKPESFDATMHNVCLVEGKFQVFDCEYKPTFKVNKSYFVLRNVLNFAKNMQYIKNFQYDTLEAFYIDICKKYNISYNLDADLEREISIQDEISKGKSDINICKKVLKSGLNNNTKVVKVLGLPLYKKKKIANKRQINVLGIKFSYKKKGKNE